MIQPLTKAQRLYEQAAARLIDEDDVDEFTLRRWLKEAHAALPDANAEGLWALWTIIGLIEQRFSVGEEGGPDKAHLQAALNAHLNALHVEPRNPQTAISIGKVLGELDREREALEYFELAERNVPVGSDTYFLILANRVAANFYLGDVEQANVILRRAIAQVRPDDAISLVRLATSAALLDHEDDAVELLARSLAAAQGIDRGDLLPIDAVRSAPPELLARSRIHPVLRSALRNVLARAEDPIPDDMATSAAVILSPEDWTRFVGLAGS